MCQEPTELLWIGLLTGFILILKIQIRYMDTKHQLADILTNGNFTRDEWNNLLRLFNISHLSSTCCPKNSSLTSSPKTMAKRMQEQKREERSGEKSKSTATNLSSHVPTSSSSAKSLIASKSPVILTATGETWEQDEKKFKIRRSVEFPNATSKMHTLVGWRTKPLGSLSLQNRNQGMWTFASLKPGVIKKRQSWGDPLLVKRLRRNPMHPVNQTTQ